MATKLNHQQLHAERARYVAELQQATDPDARRVAEARLAEIETELARRNGAAIPVHCQNPWPQVPLLDLIRASGCTVSPKDEDESKYEGDHAAAHGSKSGRCLVVWENEGRWHCTSCKQGGDAADWVEAQLAQPQAAGTTRVLMHSVVWQYLGTERQARIAAAMQAAGSRADTARPLAWVRMEPDRDLARHEIWVETWPGDGARRIGFAHAHGAWVEVSDAIPPAPQAPRD